MRVLRTDKHSQLISQWPEWRCVNCHREYPSTTKHRKCQGRITTLGGQTVVEPCGGHLIRYKEYEAKL